MASLNEDHKILILCTTLQTAAQMLPKGVAAQRAVKMPRPTATNLLSAFACVVNFNLLTSLNSIPLSLLKALLYVKGRSKRNLNAARPNKALITI